MNASEWVVRFAPLVTPSGSVLDVACGNGRHTRFFLARGHEVVAVDIDLSKVSDLQTSAFLKLIEADIEGDPWPLPDARFDAVVVTNYLHRQLFDRFVEAVAPEGLLIYETYARGNERWGRPSNPDFLLRPGELLEVARGRLRVVAYEDVTVMEPRPAAVQRLCAIAPPSHVVQSTMISKTKERRFQESGVRGPNSAYKPSSESCGYCGTGDA